MREETKPEENEPSTNPTAPRKKAKPNWPELIAMSLPILGAKRGKDEAGDECEEASRVTKATLPIRPEKARSRAGPGGLGGGWSIAHGDN